MGKKYIHFIDTETTGLVADRHELLEVAVVTEEVNPSNPKLPGRIVREWCRKVKPQNLAEAEPKALEVNGYNDTDWKNASPFADLARELLGLLQDGTIVGHNVKFDVGFLEASFRRAGITPKIGYHHIDTVALAYARWGLPGDIDRLSLDYLRGHLGIPVEGGHAALKDALDCREVFYRTLA